MFDVSFAELLAIGVVALLVIGPERLPRVARTAGLLIGRLQRYAGSVKADIHREIQLDELRRLQQDVQESARTMEQSVNEQLASVEGSVKQSLAEAEAAIATSSTVAESATPPAPADASIPSAAIAPAELNAHQEAPAAAGVAARPKAGQ